MTVPSCWRRRLDEARRHLEQRGIPEAEGKLRWVAAHLLETGLLDVFRHLDEAVSPDLDARFQTAVARLAGQEPVQYVIGETDFCGLTFRCDPRALIPRPETELLAAAAMDFLRGRQEPAVVVEVGTGSGCLACAIARHFPLAQVWATDISPAALALARENARRLGVRVNFLEGDLLAPVPDNSADLVVANLPYVATAQWEHLDPAIRNHEPRLALDGGSDGLRLISRLVSDAGRVIRCQGRLMLEIGEDQAAAVMELVCRNNLSNPSLKYDYAGNPRVVTACRMSR